MLASHLATAVISLRPKSVWDIAAGSIMLHKIGVDFYEEGIRIDRLEHRRYGSKLIWAKKDVAHTFLGLI
jgi:3'-phosphoadenosine 5'-phosphosulfate (PAPS) 3'-phosphatase